MKKLIFLDIDGVVNSTQDHKAIFRLDGKQTYMGPPKIQPGAPFTRENLNWGKRQVDNLAHIIRRTGAEVVIHSTWKQTFNVLQFRDMFNRYNVKIPVIGVTEDMVSKKIEIYEWVKPDMNYVILDDSSDFFPSQQPHHVQTDREVGLTADDARRAIEILNSEE